MVLFSRRGGEKKSFAVEGMTCEHCRKSIEEGLKSIGGISSAKVSLKKKRAHITFDPQSVALEEISKKVEELGYKAVME